MTRLRQLLIVAAVLLLTAAVCLGQGTPGKKTYTFHGKVTAVNQSAKSLTVDGEKVEGWMDAMTMDYKVDDPAVFKKVKPGDRIMATVYDGDLTLHQVQVMPPGGAPKSKK